jgi:hypothetical protein
MVRISYVLMQFQTMSPTPMSCGNRWCFFSGTWFL